MSKRILLLVHTALVPDLETNKSQIDRTSCPWITEYDVATTLIKLGHHVEILGLDNSVDKLITTLQSKTIDCVFNLLEEFNSNTRMESKIVALLELYNQKYSGCNSKGLLLAKDKSLSKKILSHHHIDTANFFTMPKGKKKKLPKVLNYPLIVKCLFEEASYGIARASIVNNEKKLLERLRYVHEQLDQDAIVEEFIEGKEYFIAVFGDKKLTVFPPMELVFDKVESPEKEIYSSRAKWNENYRKRNGIDTRRASLDSVTVDKLCRICKKVYRVLDLSGYARIDVRITKEQKIYILEANPNPNISLDDDFAKSALLEKIKYPKLIELLIK